MADTKGIAGYALWAMAIVSFFSVLIFVLGPKLKEMAADRKGGA